MRKKIVLLFNKKKPEKDPFWDFAHKKIVYYEFFKQGFNAGFDMYLASRNLDYLGNLNFSNPLFFDGKKFKKTNGIITADAVYDRSGGLKFPSKKIGIKTLNCKEFKTLCNNKNEMYSHIGSFMPTSFKVKNQKIFSKIISDFLPNDLIVIKPAEGLGGKGIMIDKASVFFNFKIDQKKEWVIQKFIDTSHGIPGVTKGKHDLRIVIIGGKIIFAHIRKPKKESYLANVAQGVSIEEILLNKIPKNIIEVVKKIQKILDKKYHYPIYSIDFGIENKKPFVFELNDQIGFPSEKMESYPIFIKALIKSLKKIAYTKFKN